MIWLLLTSLLYFSKQGLKHFPTKAAGCKRERPLVPRTAEVKRAMGIFIFLLSRKTQAAPDQAACPAPRHKGAFSGSCNFSGISTAKSLRI